MSPRLRRAFRRFSIAWLNMSHERAMAEWHRCREVAYGEDNVAIVALQRARQRLQGQRAAKSNVEG